MTKGWKRPTSGLFGWLNDVFKPLESVVEPAVQAAKSDEDLAAEWLLLDEESPVYRGMEAIQDVSGEGMDLSQRAYEIKAEEILAIQRFNSKGFTTYEINPRLLSQVDNACVLPPDEFYETAGFAPPVLGLSFDAYKSVILPVTGNFLRIEFGPPRFRDNFNQTPPFGSGGFGVSAQVDRNDGPIFLNFGDVSGKAFKVRHGDTYKLYYNTIILSFPGTFGKVRVITGFNSEMDSNRETIQELHIAGTDVVANGIGLLKPTCFCVGNNQGGDSALSLVSGVSQTVAVVYQTPNPTNAAVGESNVGWVTSFNAVFNATAGARVRLALGIGAPVSVQKYIFLREYVFVSGLNQVDEKFDIPIRFAAGGGTGGGLVFSVMNIGAGDINAGRFFVNGWSLGPIFAGSNQLPVYFRYSLDHVPWGVDVIGGFAQL